MKWFVKTTIWMTVAFVFFHHVLSQGVTPKETTFDRIEGQNLLTTDGRGLAIGNKIHVIRTPPLHEVVFKDGGYVTFPINRNPCWANLDQCNAGFTLIVETKLTILYDDDLVIASNGADNYQSQGMLLSYSRRKWGFVAMVKTSTLKWMAEVPYHWLPKKWHEIVFSWSPKDGIVVLIDGFITGAQKTSSTIKKMTKTNPLCLGCSYSQRKFTSSFSVLTVTQADTFYKNLIEAGKLSPDKHLPEKSETVVDFQDIVGKQIIGRYVRMDYSGTVTLGQDDAGKVLIMETPGTYVNIRKIGHPCLDNIESCATGFTLRIVFTLTSNTNDRQVLLSSGSETQNVRGMSVHYQDKSISVFVKTSSQGWTSRFPYTFVPGVWYSLDITWSSDWGIELHVDNRFIPGKPGTGDPATKTSERKFLLGKAVGDAKTTSMRVFEIVLWKSMHERLDKADMVLPRLKDIKIITTTSTTIITSPTTTAKPTPVGCPELKSTLTFKALTDVNGHTTFSCILSEVPDNKLEVQMVFRVQGEASQWFKVIGNPDKEASVSVAEMGLKLYDKKIYCSARARFFVRGAQWCSEKIDSNTFHVSLKIQSPPEQIVIWEGQSSYDLVVSSTVPPSAFCRPEDQSNCRVEILTTLSTAANELRCPFKEIIPQAVFGVGVVGPNPRACGVILTKQNWRKDIKIPIKATLDRKLDGNQERLLRVTAKISSLVTGDESVIELQKIKVKIVENNKNKICSSYNDPHLKTFDARPYDMHIPGEFVLYKHRQLEYEVRALYQRCASAKRPTCNRAVAVRSGDDVISFTTSKKAGVSVQMYLNGKLTPSTRIKRHGSGGKYEVLLPHGTVVTVQYTSGIWISIYIKPSSTDLRQTEGLCGMFNDRTDDDFDFMGSVKAFASKWKRTDSMFHGVPAQKQKKAPVYCSCQENQAPRCEPNLDGFYCLTTPSSVIDITNVLTQQAQTPQMAKQRRGLRVKRATLDDETPEIAFEAAAPEKWTLESAQKYCENYLESARQVKMCSSHLDTNETQLSVDNCAWDIVALGNKRWAATHLDRLIDVCFTTVTRDVQEWTKTSDGTVGPPSALVDGLCPFVCGDHGECQYGVCNCNYGWTGDRCNIGVDTTPEVFPTREACDLLTSMSSCDIVGVEGDKFVPTSNLTCVFQFLEITESKIENVGQPEMVDAMYVSQYKVTCKQPDTGDQARSAFVAISNNGGRTTSVDRHLHVVHKSSCQECDIAEDGRSVSCSKVAESCEIDGRCYGKYELYEEDACYRCDPGKRKDGWTLTSEPKCLKDEESSSTNTLAIVFIVLCVVLAIALIIMIVLVIRLKRMTSDKCSIKFDKTEKVTLQSGD